MLLIPEFITSNNPIILPYRFTLILATLIGINGRKSGSLSLSGAITATIIGFLTLANPLKLFGVCLLTFYFSGSRATKWKASHKLTLEDPDHSSPSSTSPSSTSTIIKPGGNRSSFQVLSNSLLATIFALIWRLLYSGELADGQDWKARLWVGSRGSRWCVIDSRQLGFSVVKPLFGELNFPYSKILVLGTVAFFASCAGDTFASELGILSSSPPFMITTLRTAKPGTNGAVSNLGLILSALGGMLIGAAASISIYIENPECRGLSAGSIGGIQLPWWLLLIGVGTWSGFVGSLIDSILGATLQETLYSETRNKVVHSKELKVEDEVIVKLGGFDVLNNSIVNILSSTLTTLFVISYFISKV